MCCNNSFQTHTFKISIFNVFFSSCFDRFDAIFVGNNDLIAFFKAVERLSILS